MFGLTKPDG
jgi:hypothetical protein